MPSSLPDGVWQQALQAMEMASKRAILVRCGDRSTSGILLEDVGSVMLEGPRGALVLAPGLVLLGEKGLPSLTDKQAVKELRIRAPSMTVVMRRKRAKVQSAVSPASAAPAVPLTSQLRQPQDRPGDLESDELVEVPARVVAAWRWEELSTALPQLMSELTLTDEEAREVVGKDPSNEDLKEVRDMLSVFLVLQFQPVPDHASSLTSVLARMLELVKDVPPRGTPVCAACAPLGAPGLLGAVSGGVVSGTASVLTLTDCRVAPGSEGAGVYRVDGVSTALPFAVVLAPLIWWRGETVGFTLCLGLRRLLLDAVRELGLDEGGNPSQSEDPDVYGLDRSVVLIRSGLAWGSGLVVGPDRNCNQNRKLDAPPARCRERLILTCSHVVRGQDEVLVCWGRESVRGRVVWRAADGVPYDLAVLKLSDDWLQEQLVPLPLNSTQPRNGEPVLAAGFPLFSERSWHRRHLRPILTRGNISGWWPSTPSQILTTCCVQSGNSGGPLLRLSPAVSGDYGVSRVSVIGIVVCTVTTGTAPDSVIYPHVNFALWADVFVEPVNEYFCTGDERVFKKIHCRGDNRTERQWKLLPPKISKL